MTATRRPPARTPEEYLDAIDQRCRRRLMGGLWSIHGRGRAQFGASWNVVAAFGAALALALGWRALRGPAKRASRVLAHGLEHSLLRRFASAGSRTRAS